MNSKKLHYNKSKWAKLKKKFKLGCSYFLSLAKLSERLIFVQNQVVRSLYCPWLISSSSHGTISTVPCLSLFFLMKRDGHPLKPIQNKRRDSN